MGRIESGKRRIAGVLAGVIALAALSGCGPRPAGQEDAQTPAASGPAAPPVFAMCLSCHSTQAGGVGSGPSLHGVVGRKAGTLAGYPYSPALAAMDVVWTRETLDRWLASPMTMVPGTKMAMPVPDPAARAQIIDYLETLR